MDMRKSIPAATRRTFSNDKMNIGKVEGKMNDVSKAILYVIAKKKKRKMNDVSKAILSVVAKKRRKTMCEEEEKIKRNEDRNPIPLYFSKEKKMKKSSITKRKRNDVDEGIPNNLGKGKTKDEDDQEEEKHKRNGAGEGILSKNKRNNLGKGRTKDEEEEHNATPGIIKIGDTVDLSRLLFTKNRNFLINYNQQRVEAKDLSGKLVVLYFMSLTPYYNDWRTMTEHLRDIYTKLHPRGDFEIVFVAIMGHAFHNYQGRFPTPHGCFLKEFSTMPWLAIPFSDLESSKRLETIFRSEETTTSFSIIIDPRGVVLQCDANPLFLRYGAAGYPFTNDRMQFIDSEDNLLRMQQPLSIQKLLATPERDYLINNNGDQVPLHGLDHKVVGLYFCPCLDQRLLLTTGKLEKVYQELSSNTKEFEIVLIYTNTWRGHYVNCCGPMVEDSFLNEINTMPWLALPFEDTNCNKKLQRIFQHPQELGGPARLVIIGPYGKFIEPLGTHILQSYGAPAYPFSLRSAVNLELEMVKQLKLEMLWDLDTVFTQKNGSQVPFSQFIGKRIIVIFQRNPSCMSNGFLRELKARYIRMKGTNDEFEVIHICDPNYGAFDNKKIAPPMPWFMHPPFAQGSYVSKYIGRVWPDYHIVCGLLAFDRDGSVVRMKKDPELGDNMVFPFYQDGDMENEILLHVREYIK